MNSTIARCCVDVVSLFASVVCLLFVCTDEVTQEVSVLGSCNNADVIAEELLLEELGREKTKRVDADGE